MLLQLDDGFVQWERHVVFLLVEHHFERHGF